jgi:Na+/H+ antiporter NhaA
VSLHAVREVLSGPAVDKLAGVGLILATAAALAWANSPLAASYEALREATFGLPFDPALSNTAKRWTNDGLMTLFFLLVGLEIKREVVEGALSQPSRSPCRWSVRWAAWLCRRWSTWRSTGAIPP